jgi:hypothetical protein
MQTGDAHQLVVPINKNSAFSTRLSVFPMSKYGEKLKDRTSCCSAWFFRVNW